MRDNVIWGSVVDGKWTVEVHRAAEYKAHLKIWNDKDELVFEKPVPLSYGAIFGPDVDDVYAWQETALQFIDNQ